MYSQYFSVRNFPSQNMKTTVSSFVMQESVKRQKVWSCSSNLEQDSVHVERISTTRNHSGNQKVKNKHKRGYRKWFCSKSHSADHFQDKFVFVSYNILGDDNALFHNDLYCHIPRHLMDWSGRKRLICKELDIWKPDIMCLQEVDHFDELVQDLGRKGYSGIFKRRTGEAKDGCAIFWRNDIFSILQEESIEFKEFDLRDNVAQLCVFELKKNLACVREDIKTKQVGVNLRQAENHEKKRRVVIGNIHVLFNPKRGDIKLGQVRVLLQEAHVLSEKWGKAPIAIAGDFNSTPQSALYQFLASSELDLLPHDRRQISGQIENELGSDIQHFTYCRQQRYKWSPDELKTATGSENCTRLQHPLKLSSAYASVRGSSKIRDHSGEPLATSYHSKFLGTVDYIWRSEGLIPLRVLETLPLDVLRQTPGLPTSKWGSDHLAIACEFAFASDE